MSGVAQLPGRPLRAMVAGMRWGAREELRREVHVASTARVNRGTGGPACRPPPYGARLGRRTPTGARPRGRCPAGAAGAARTSCKPWAVRSRNVAGGLGGADRSAPRHGLVPYRWRPNSCGRRGRAAAIGNRTRCRRWARVGRRRGDAAVPAGALRCQRSGERGEGSAARAAALRMPAARSVSARLPRAAVAGAALGPAARTVAAALGGRLAAPRQPPSAPYPLAPGLPRFWAAGLAPQVRRAGPRRPIPSPARQAVAGAVPWRAAGPQHAGRSPKAPPPAVACGILMRRRAATRSVGAVAEPPAARARPRALLALRMPRPMRRAPRAGRPHPLWEYLLKARGGSRLHARCRRTAHSAFPRPPANAKCAAPPPHAALGPAHRRAGRAFCGLPAAALPAGRHA